MWRSRASRPHPKKDLGVRAKSLKKSDLIRLLFLPFSYFTTPAVLHMRYRKNSLSGENEFIPLMTSTVIQPQQYIVQFYSK